jgi:hypothetical protein
MMGVGVALLILLNVTWCQTVHSVEIPGLLGQRVDFFEYRSLLGRDGFIYVGFSNGAETKRPFLGPGAVIEQVRRGTTVDYDGQTLTVHGPNGEQLSVPGYAR